jgi:hypothetical protein
MTMQAIDAAAIRAAIDQARQSSRQIDDLRAANARTIRTLETALNQSIKGPLMTPLTIPAGAAEHRRLHRSGRPSNLVSDPELLAFVVARIGTMTFAEIVSAVAAHFPPERRTSISALSRWWRANRPNRQIPPNPS